MFKDNTGKEYEILEEEVFSTPSVIFMVIKTENISFLVRSFEDKEKLHDYAEKICEIENERYIFVDKSKDFKKMHEKAKRLSENIKELLNIDCERFKW